MEQANQERSASAESHHERNGSNPPAVGAPPVRTAPSVARVVTQTLVVAGLAGLSVWAYPRVAARFAVESKSAPPSAKGGARRIPVLTADAKTGDLPIYLDSLGTVAAFNTVTIRSRVDGEIVKVGFEEGQQIKAGDLIAQIDPRPFEVQIAQAKGSYTRDMAMLKNAREDLERNSRLLKSNTISTQEYAAQASLVHQLEGTVAADKAAIDNAQLQLEFARVASPIGGRIGLRKVDLGNYVRAGDAGGLAVVAQTRPISVVFTVPQDEVARIRKENAKKPLAVEVYGQDLTALFAQGTVSAVDNQVDVASGTVKVKATFPNDDDALFPNQFVNVRLRVETLNGVIVAPTAAVQHGPDFDFVYVVTSEEKVDLRRVKVGATEGERAVIRTGLKAGETVVTQGFDKLQPGAAVELRAAGEKSEGAAKAQSRPSK